MRRCWLRAAALPVRVAPAVRVAPGGPGGPGGPGPAGQGGGEDRQQAGQLLLDENALGAATGYIEIGVAEPSPDNRLLAWSADTSGAEIYELRFTEIETGSQLPEVIARSYPGGAWSADSAQFFYLVPDGLNRPWQVWRHAVGSAADSDVLVYQESDARFELTLAASRSGELIIITAASRDTTEVWLIPASRPLSAPVVVEPRRRGVEYRVDHAAVPGGGGDLLIVTDDGHAEFTLMRAPVAAPGRASWTLVGCPSVAPARPDTRLVRCDVLAGHLLLTLRRDGAPLLAITGPDGAQATEVRPELAAGAIAVQYAADYEATAVVVVEESLIEPPRWSELDLAAGLRRELKRAPVPHYDARQYRTTQLSATVGDGTRVPGLAGLPGRNPAGRDRAVRPVRLRRLRGMPGRRIRPRPAVAARPRSCVRGRARPRRRRARQALVAAGQAAGQACHVQRLHRRRGLAGRRCGRVGAAGGRHQDRLPRAIGRRPAAGCRVLARARAVARGCRRGPVRRLRDHACWTRISR